jgi:hypothetical protein
MVARSFFPAQFFYRMTPSVTRDRKRRRWRWWALGSVVALVGAVWLALFPPLHKPVARVPLPDGTELRLEYVTYGTVHRVPGLGKFRAWVAGQLEARWPRLGVTSGVAEYVYESEYPELRLWFTRYDPRRRKFLPDVNLPLDVEEVNALEGTPFLVPHVPDSPGSPGTTHEYEQPMPHCLVGMGNYERRRPVVHLRVRIQGQTAVLAVPNPAAKLPFPVWQAEPLPQTRRIGKVDLVLRELRPRMPDEDGVELPTGDEGKGPRAVEPVFEVLRDGEPAQVLDLWDGVFVDPTGNRSSLSTLPSLSERVWKLQANVRRNESYPFDETEGLLRGPVPLPGRQRYHVFELSKDEVTQGLRLVALVGPGHYLWQDGEFVAAGEPFSEKAEADAFFNGGLADDGSLRINAAAHVLVVLFQAGKYHSRTKWGRADLIVARGKCDSPDFALWNFAPDTVQNNVPPLGLSSAFCYQLKVPDAGNGTEATPQTTVQVVPVNLEPVEFFVEAPKAGK